MFVRIYTTDRGTWSTEIDAEFAAQRTALGLSVSDLAVERTDPAPWPDHSAILYFVPSASAGSPKDGNELDTHISAGRVVIPVIADAKAASNMPPGEVQKLNAFVQNRYGAGWATALVDQVLARIWLAREARKVFISYRRDDAAGVADQLHRELGRAGLDVFFDEVSIQPGSYFERELKWRMNDADCVLLLASPSIDQSTWVKEEIRFANAAQIAVLALFWPGVTGALHGTLLPFQRLDDFVASDFVVRQNGVQELASLAAERLLRSIHGYRAQAVKRRLDDLLPAARVQYEGSGGGQQVDAGVCLGDLRVSPLAGPGPAEYVRVLPFRPTVDTVHRLDKDLASARFAPAPPTAAFFFAENDPADLRAESLRWMVERGPTVTTERTYRFDRLTGAK